MIEQLASIEHDRWSRWHRYARDNWTPDRVSRWNELALRLYEELDEPTKEKDREEVRHYLPLIAEALRACDQKAYERGVYEQYEKLMGHVWPEGLNDDIHRLLKNRTITGEVDLNWLVDSVGELITIAALKAEQRGLERAAQLVEESHKQCAPPMCEIANKIRALGEEMKKEEVR